MNTNTVTLRDKIGHMLIIGFDGKTVTQDSPIVEAIYQHNIGGVILFDYNYQTKQFDKNIESPDQVKQLNTNLQKLTEQANTKQHRPTLPLIISVDYEGGYVDRLHQRYGFIKTLSAAEVGKKNLLETQTIAEQMAVTLQDNGFNLNFAPVIDVNVNPDNPIIGKLDRSFSNDPSIICQHARIFAQQFSQHSIQYAYKHFPGHGSSTDDSHLGFVDVTDTWQPLELEPYRILLNQKPQCDMIMTAHIVNRQLDSSGLPATLSHAILTNILRKELSFDGIIITDDMQMKAISDNFSLEQALTLAINAGIDMMIFGNQLTSSAQDPKQLIDIIEANVQAGKISEDRINDAYQRILAFKQVISHNKKIGR